MTRAPSCFVPRSFSMLRSLTCAQLAELGCRRWDDEGLMLFPASWFGDIPEGFEVVTILGKRVPFARTMSRDHRFGVLSFGVVGFDPGRADTDEGDVLPCGAP